MHNDRHVTLCGETLPGVRHVCAFFDSRDEMYDILTPYYQEGIDEGERVITILQSAKHSDHKERLESAGLPIDELRSSGQFQIFASEDTYTQGGVFASERMFNMLEQVLIDAETSEYGSVRTHGDMEWALENLPGTDELMIYETRVNLLTPKHNCTLLCAYDINKFSGRAIADILASHSHVILNGRVHKNPHFVEPLTMLQELLHRKKRPLLKDESMQDHLPADNWHQHAHIVPAISEAAKL